MYIGGGTPPLLSEELKVILETMRQTFTLADSVCLETDPTHVTPDILKTLKMAGVTQLSVGVQSFQDRFLQFIGRPYTSAQVYTALHTLRESDFQGTNLDLIFALPEQTLDDVQYDLEQAVTLGISQITTYPLFTFPYSSIGQYLRLKQVKMPNFLQRRTFYYHIHRYLQSQHFERVSVWGFKREQTPRYSSVTRDGYLGLGAGAGSHLSHGFYLNTFSVKDYIKSCLASQFPTALYLHFTPAMQQYFWLYWRFYETAVPKAPLAQHFPGHDKKLHSILILLKRFRFLQETPEAFRLTLSGSFWVHLLQP